MVLDNLFWFPNWIQKCNPYHQLLCFLWHLRCSIQIPKKMSLNLNFTSFYLLLMLKRNRFVFLLLTRCLLVFLFYSFFRINQFLVIFMFNKKCFFLFLLMLLLFFIVSVIYGYCLICLIFDSLLQGFFYFLKCLFSIRSFVYFFKKME